MKRVLLALVLAWGGLPCAWAGDAEAKKLFDRAVKHWNDPDPDQAISLLEQALDEAESKVFKLNMHLALGQLHQGKTGDFEAALEHYNKMVRLTIGSKEPRIRNLKAQAMFNKATILYSREDDSDAAIQMYQDAYNTYPTAKTTDVLSQLFFRVARKSSRSGAARAKQLQTALKLSEEALRRDAKAKRRSAAITAKYRLQKVIVLEALGQKEEAKAFWEATNREALDVNSLYQQAVLAALQGKSAAEVAQPLKEALAPTVRPKAAARNQLRKFIRTEPDFAAFLKDPSWAKLVNDEK